MKGYIRVGGAVVLGAVVITAALYLRPNDSQSNEGTVAVVSPERIGIQSYDANGNGIQDWEEELQKKIFESTPAEAPDANSGDLSKTFTDRFARSFFEDFMKAKSSGDPLQNQEQFINNAVTAIEQSTESKIYTRDDLQIIESSAETVRQYGNDVANIIVQNAIEKEDEGLILSRALESNNPKLLDSLAPIKKVYEVSLTESLRVPVPSTLVNEHLALLNAYQAMFDDASAMEQAFTDPLYTMARMKHYQDDAAAFYNSFLKLNDVFTKSGITYANDEPGVLFQHFKPL